MNTLTCVYCGYEYPEGTPPHGAQVLTDHIKICGKHPMRTLEEKYAKVPGALVGLIGTDKKEELEAMKILLKVLPASDKDREDSINAVNALLETLE